MHSGLKYFVEGEQAVARALYSPSFPGTLGINLSLALLFLLCHFLSQAISGCAHSGLPLATEWGLQFLMGLGPVVVQQTGLFCPCPHFLMGAGALQEGCLARKLIAN